MGVFVLPKVGVGLKSRNNGLSGLQKGSIRPQAFFRRFFFRLIYPLSRISGGVEWGLGGLSSRSSEKIRQKGGWEARRSKKKSPFPPPSPAAKAYFYRILCGSNLNAL